MIREGGGRKIQKESDLESLGLGDGSEREKQTDNFIFLFLQFRTIAIIAEGIPENKTKLMIKKANEKNVAIIGPATVSHSSVYSFCSVKHRYFFHLMFS